MSYRFPSRAYEPGKGVPMPRSRYRFVSSEHPYFMTSTVNGWLPVFTRRDTVEIVLDSWRYLQKTAGFMLYGYVILENHIHFIANSGDLGSDIQRFKSWTGRQILSYLQSAGESRILDQLAMIKRGYKKDSKYQLWEEGIHPQLIESKAVMRQKLDYIHFNPVKRGYVDEPEHWCYSSARNYAGKPGMIEVVYEW